MWRAPPQRPRVALAPVPAVPPPVPWFPSKPRVATRRSRKMEKHYDIYTPQNQNNMIPPKIMGFWNSISFQLFGCFWGKHIKFSLNPYKILKRSLGLKKSPPPFRRCFNNTPWDEAIFATYLEPFEVPQRQAHHQRVLPVLPQAVVRRRVLRLLRLQHQYLPSAKQKQFTTLERYCTCFEGKIWNLENHGFLRKAKLVCLSDQMHIFFC